MPHKDPVALSAYLKSRRQIPEVRQARIDAQRRYREKNREVLNKKDRAYSNAHPETKRKSSYKWRTQNPEKSRESNCRSKKNRRILEPGVVREMERKWREANLEKYRQSHNKASAIYQRKNLGLYRRLANEKNRRERELKNILGFMALQRIGESK